MLREAVAVVALSCASVACGGESSSEPVPLTRDQATVMAELLYRNYESGGADFTMSTPVGPGGGTVTVTGEVDWTNHQGHATVASSQPGESPLVEVWWDERNVFERRPVLDEPLRESGLVVSEAVIRRPVDTGSRRIDQLIAVLIGLAATQRDNAELIAQAEGSAFVRDDTLRGSNVEVLRYGPRTQYWVDTKSGEMARFEGVDSSGQYPVIVDVFARGERPIAADPALEVVDYSEIPPTITDLMSTSP